MGGGAVLRMPSPPRAQPVLSVRHRPTAWGTPSEFSSSARVQQGPFSTGFARGDSAKKRVALARDAKSDSSPIPPTAGHAVHGRAASDLPNNDRPAIRERRAPRSRARRTQRTDVSTARADGNPPPAQRNFRRDPVEVAGGRACRQVAPRVPLNQTGGKCPVEHAVDVPRRALEVDEPLRRRVRAPRAQERHERKRETDVPDHGWRSS
jgi:hypothetical protein